MERCPLCGTPIRYVNLPGKVYKRPCICNMLKSMQLGNILKSISKDLTRAQKILDVLS